MPRPLRCLTPGALYHIYNRALARRTAFETRADFRFFLALVAIAVRRHQWAVEGFVLLPTHFHLLIRAAGDEREVSSAMRWIEGVYARYFNRTRRRDGPLWRGRFNARLVDSTTYRYLLHLYIDGNPVQARLCARSSDYPYGSAHYYARRRGPPWLDRRWVEDQVRHHARLGAYDPKRHAVVFPSRIAPLQATLVRARMALGSRRAPDDLDNLVRAAPPAVRAWMERKARLADGTAPGLPVSAPAAVRRAVRAECWSAARSPGAGRTGPAGSSVVDVAILGLLRDACGLSLLQAARETDRTMARAESALRDYRRRLLNDAAFADAAARALRNAVRWSVGTPSTAEEGAWHRTG